MPEVDLQLVSLYEGLVSSTGDAAACAEGSLDAQGRLGAIARQGVATSGELILACAAR